MQRVKTGIQLATGLGRRRSSNDPDQLAAASALLQRKFAQQQQQKEQQTRAFSRHKSHGLSYAHELDCQLHKDARQLNILLLSNRYNSLSQRVSLELQMRDHTTTVVEPENEAGMIQAAREVNPDLILCPFLTKRVPEELWRNNAEVPCLIVHPGVEGDRGVHSLDWALHHHEKRWGVTVLEASEEMDAGDIWSTKEFTIARDGQESTLTKSSLYANEVTHAAATACIHAVQNYAIGVRPKPLDYASPVVKGRCQAQMKKADREVDWEKSADEIGLSIRASDSQPGAIARFRANDAEHGWTEDFRVFGAHVEQGLPSNTRALPGQVIGQRDGAILVKCGQGALWVTHLKSKKLKLPATSWLPTPRTLAPVLPAPALEIPHGSHPTTYQEIWMTVDDGVCYLHFDFYNGAMSTDQCKRLSRVMHSLREDDRFNVVCLMGGYNFFSNGIHLNVIESAKDQAMESWKNINAIDDVVKDVFTMTDKITISAMQGNAGAGGCMMALAGDLVWAKGGCVLNPSYRAMGLFGSEYHTYFFNDRVGDECASKMTAATEPVLAEQALNLGLVDEVLGHSTEEFREAVEEQSKKVARMRHLTRILAQKRRERTPSWYEELEKCRELELQAMKGNFQDPSYHEARSKFVYH